MFRHLFNSMFFVYQDEAGKEEIPGGGGTAPETKTDPIDPSVVETGNEGTDPLKTEEPGLKPGDVPDTEEGSSTFFYGESEVTLDIPEDLSKELESKGLDVNALAAELYGKDSNFTLKPETRDKLDAAFGKFAVDAYLNSLKLTNDSFLREQKDAQVGKEKADADRFTSIAGLVGGEEGWDALAGWGNENLSQEEIDDLNAVMGSGNESLQKYAIQMLANKRRAAEGDPEAVLIQGDNGSPESGGAALSAAAYREAEQQARKEFRGNQSGYKAAVAKLDSRRRAGIAKGL